MKKILVPLALSLALGTTACGRSDEPANVDAGNEIVLNDEDAIGVNGDADLSVVPPDNTAAAEFGNGAGAGDASLTASNGSLGNGF